MIALYLLWKQTSIYVESLLNAPDKRTGTDK